MEGIKEIYHQYDFFERKSLLVVETHLVETIDHKVGHTKTQIQLINLQDHGTRHYHRVS